MQLKGIIFDMDGTLCTRNHFPQDIAMKRTYELIRWPKEGEPQNHMFIEMRNAVQIPKDIDILDYIHSLPDKQQAEAFAKIEEIERRAMAEQVPQPGLVELMEYLDAKGVGKAICTRNFE